jgi:TatD DNase family protein
MIDTHCHLYVEEFQGDIEYVLENAKKDGVEKFFLPAIDSSTHESMIWLEKKFPSCCFAMIGLHPCSVKENYKDELSIIESLLEERSFAAIGETGLDFYWDKSFVNEQVIALHKQVELAITYNLPLVLHTRNAMQETIDVVKMYKNTSLTGIFHCFGGTLEEARQVIECNFLLGIGGVVTYKNAGLDKVLPSIPIESLVLETDAPYLAPVPYRGKRNESRYLVEIAKKIAEIKNISEVEVQDATTLNAEQLFKIHHS